MLWKKKKKPLVNEWKLSYCAHCWKPRPNTHSIVLVSPGKTDVKLLCEEHFNIAISTMLHGINIFNQNENTTRRLAKKSFRNGR